MTFLSTLCTAPTWDCVGDLWSRIPQVFTHSFITTASNASGVGRRCPAHAVCCRAQSGWCRLPRDAPVSCDVPASHDAPASTWHQGLVSGCWMGSTSLSYQTTSFILSLSSSSCCHGTHGHVPMHGVPASLSRPFPHWHPQPTLKHIHLFLRQERAASGNRSINHQQCLEIKIIIVINGVLFLF